MPLWVTYVLFQGSGEDALSGGWNKFNIVPGLGAGSLAGVPRGARISQSKPSRPAGRSRGRSLPGEGQHQPGSYFPRPLVRFPSQCLSSSGETSWGAGTFLPLAPLLGILPPAAPNLPPQMRPPTLRPPGRDFRKTPCKG